MSLRVRIALTVLALTLLSGALVLAYSGVAIRGPFLQQGDPRFGHVVTFGGTPFWLFLPMLAGLALLFAAWAVKEATRLGAWGSLMLLLLWGLQATGHAGIIFYGGLPLYEEQPTFWESEAFFVATAWGLGLLAGALVVAVVTEWLWPLARGAQPEPTTEALGE
jgi:hypothetical protein